MDFENIASNIYESACDMDTIGTPDEVKQECITAMVRALKSMECLTKNNINSYEYSCLLGALERIFDK